MELASLTQISKCQQRLVRLGGDGDGGYLVPDELEGISALFSPGVQFSANFELALADRGIRCFLADASVKSAPVEHQMIHFESLNIGSESRLGSSIIGLDDWVEQNAPDASDLVLQMDIDGGEWEVFLGVTEATIKRFRIMVVEFHDLHLACLDANNALQRSVFGKIARHFKIVHWHANNFAPPVSISGRSYPRVAEATFLRNDFFLQADGPVILPHTADMDNSESHAPAEMPLWWYK